MEDRRIVELFCERSESAIAELAAKYGGALTKIAFGILGNQADAEECVNDAYLGAWNTIPPEKAEPLFTYVAKILRNTALKRYHFATAAKRDSRYDAALSELEECIPSRESVEDRLDSARLTELLNSFLGNLERENRIMFVRRYWYADSVTDIAKELGMNSHAVTVRLGRIREKLRKYLTEEGMEL